MHSTQRALRGPSLLVAVVLLGIVLAGCTGVTPAAPDAAPATTALPTAAAASEEPPATALPAEEAVAPGMGMENPPAAAERARADLATQLGVEPAAVTIVSAEAQEWSDGCLGAGGPDEMCAQVITPGYRVTLAANGTTYTYHTDAEGNSLRQVEGTGTGAGTDAISGADQVVDVPAGDAQAGPASLEWRGPAELGSPDTSQCAGLTVTDAQVMDTTVALTACDGTTSMQPLPANLADTWADISTRVAPFSTSTDTESLAFVGSGTETAAAWQRAVLAWARVTYAELASGKTSATARTALSWNLGPLPDVADACAHLTVLDYGYAYAEQRPCAGGDVISAAAGWLETRELEQFDRWLTQNAPLTEGDNSINGTGTEGMTGAEITAVEVFARQVWERLSGLPTGESSNPNVVRCLPQPDLQVYIDAGNGFCVQFPAAYLPVETAADRVALVFGGDIMNHIDPLVSVEVTDAAGLTLPRVAQQMMGDYAADNSGVTQDNISVDAIEAVMLDNLPGQDLNRRVAVIHNGKLYSFQFTPLGEQAELLYQVVLGSFHFLD